MGFVILVVVMLAGGGTHNETWSEKFASMRDCQDAIARVEASVKSQYPDAKDIKAECKKG